MGRDRTTVEIDDIVKIKLKRMGFKIAPLFREFCNKLSSDGDNEVDIFKLYDERDLLMKKRGALDDELVKVNCEIMAFEEKRRKRKVKEDLRAKKEVEGMKASGMMGEL